MSQRCLSYLTMLCCAVMLIGTLSLLPVAAQAQTTPQPTPTDLQCTNLSQLNADTGTNDGHLLTDITTYIKNIINGASQQLFTAFTGSNSYNIVLNACASLMVIFYGIGFTFGIVQPSFGQVLVRIIKFGIIYTIASPAGWDYFNQYVATFFNDGTDQIISEVMSIGTGVPITAGSSPFQSLDHLAHVFLSPDMIIAVLGATFASGPYGMGISFLIAWAAWGVVKLLLNGLKTYALAFLVRALLFGVAPVFFIFLLFDRTRQIFSGWVNLLVFLSLRPILYFTFISFFMVMITSSMNDMMGGAELCWSEYSNVSGGPNKVAFWRFKPAGQQFPDVEKQDWKGPLSCQLNGGVYPNGVVDDKGNSLAGQKCKPYPINIVDILSFLILIYVAGKFADSIESIANELSNSYASIDAGGRQSLNPMGSASDNATTGGNTTNPSAGGAGAKNASQNMSGKRLGPPQ